MPACARCLCDGRRVMPVGVGVWPGLSAARSNLYPACRLHLSNARRMTVGSEAVGALTLEALDVALGLPVTSLHNEPIVEAAVRRQARHVRDARLRRVERALRPAPDLVRCVADLALGDGDFVFPNEIAVDDGGRWWINSRARLAQPMPGVDVPIRRVAADEFAIRLDGVRQPVTGWRRRDDHARYDAPAVLE